MKCPDLETLSAYREEELPEPEAALLAAHVAGCPRCQVALSSLTSLVTELAALRACEFTADDQARLCALVTSSPAPRARLQAFRRPAVGVALALILSFSAGFLGYSLYQRTFPATLSSRTFEAYLTDHRHYESLAGPDPDLGEFNVQVAAVR